MGDSSRPGSTGPTTRRNPSGTSKRGTPVLPINASTRADLMFQMANDSCSVRDVQTAQSHITSKWLALDDECTPATLADILFTVSQTTSIPPAVTASIRAVAFVIQSKIDSLIGDKIFDVINDKVGQAMQTVTDDLAKSQDFIKATTIAQSEATIKISDSLAKCEALETALTAATRQLQTIAETPAPAQATRSWAQVAAAPSVQPASAPQYSFDPTEPPEITKLRQRLLLRNRMIMIEPSILNETPPADIRDLINVWLKAIDDTDTDSNPRTIVKAATPQPRGALLLELDSAESASRLRYYLATDPELTEKFGPRANIVEQTHKIVLRFIPCGTDFDPSNLRHIREVEESAGIDPFSISSMTWCRPTDKRSPNQAFATATAIVTNPKAGNCLLRERVYIRDKLITIQKDERQPLLCNKCQKYGHIRRECTNDTRCTACTGPHDISVCNNRDKPCCASCGPDSHHASNSQRCPVFQRKRDDLRRRFPEDSMPFFPVPDDPTTWARAPPRPAEPLPQPQPQYNRPPRPPHPHPQQELERQHFQGHDVVPYANDFFYRQQTLHDLNNHPRPHTNRPRYDEPRRRPNNPPQPSAPAPAPAPLPSQIRDDSLDREIMDEDTVTTNPATAGSSRRPPLPPSLPARPPATFEQSLPRP